VPAPWAGGPLLAKPDAAPAANPFAQRAAGVTWKAIGQTQLGRPIEAATFGKGTRNVLVLGPLAGDDSAALGMVDKLAEYAAADPTRIADLKLTIVRDPNPDGRARRTAANGLGVLLDRNFPAANWQKLPEAGQLPSGPRPQSEAETRALVGLLADLQPELVVSVVVGPKCGLAWGGPAEQLARDLAEELTPSVQPAREATGSWVSFAGQDRGVPCLEFHVPQGASAQRNWADCGRGLIAAVGIATPEPRKLPNADTAELMPRPNGEAMLEWRAAKPPAPASTPGSEPLSSGTQARPAAFPRRELPSATPPLQPLEAGAATPDLQPTPIDHGAPDDWRPAAPPSSRRFWPADRIQRLPPVDKVGPAS
jgi:hypothetical protein